MALVVPAADWALFIYLFNKLHRGSARPHSEPRCMQIAERNDSGGGGGSLGFMWCSSRRNASLLFIFVLSISRAQPAFYGAPGP